MVPGTLRGAAVMVVVGALLVASPAHAEPDPPAPAVPVPAAPGTPTEQPSFESAPWRVPLPGNGRPGSGRLRR